MNSYSDLNIRNKLIIGFSTVVGIALAIGFFGFFQILKLERADSSLFNNGVRPMEQIVSIAANFQRLRSNIRDYILAKDQKSHDYYLLRITRFREEIDASVTKLEKALPDTESKRLFSQLVEARSNYTPHINWIIANTKTDRDEKAIAYIKSDTVYAAEHDEIEAIANLQSYLVLNAGQISEQNSETATNSGMVMLCLAIGASLLATIMTILITRSITTPISLVLGAVRSLHEDSRKKLLLVEAIAGGNLDQEVFITEPLHIEADQIHEDEAGLLLRAIIEMSRDQIAFDQAFAKMSAILRQNCDQETQRSWFRFGQNELNILLRGEKSTAEMTQQVLAFLIEYLGAGAGIFYVFNDNEMVLEAAAGYAVPLDTVRNRRLELGEGLAGQAALEQKILTVTDAPAHYLRISSGLGCSDPSHIVSLPLVHNGTLTGLVELGSFKTFRGDDLEFLTQITGALAIALSVNRSRQQVNELLEQTQSQTEELRVQQEELQQTNEELEERAQMLEQQREQIRAKNREVEEASRELQQKADELEKVSAYKSEFLANMSHELRTPLNSLMILSSLLRDNRDGNLSEKQVEFAATINGAGRDLLNLINDILDLSKIESGHLEFHYEEVALTELGEQLESVFQPVAQDKGIVFTITMEQTAPTRLSTDRQRTLQVLKNLLSNACKFTDSGSVSLRIYAPDSGKNPLGTTAVAFQVTDTGIGIPEDKQSLVFNAFQQADGSTSRTYGGTGLGLSISRQLARSMGGDVALASATGSGSTFTLYLPASGACAIAPVAAPPALPAVPQPDSAVVRGNAPAPAKARSADLVPAPLPDDRDTLQCGDKCILVIEDDLTFAGILTDMVRGRGFAVLAAADGESGIALAERYQPSAVILDVMLPHIDGWGVMRRLKDNSQTRHIPVHFVTCLEERQKAMSMGAIGFVTKPVSSSQLDAVFETLESAIEKTMKMLLIVEDDHNQAAAMVALLEERNVTIRVAESGDKAIELLSSEHFDCIVLDLGLADMGAFELLEELKKLDPERRIPVIIHTGRELSHDDERKLHHYAESIIIKGTKSPERLLNEVTLFLHLIETSLDPGKQRMIRSALDKEAMLEGKKVLIVDDDMRNIFSLSSALSEKHIVIHEAENGREALRQLEHFPDIDLVLMDIMMPEMDGYEAMRCIRRDSRFQALPIIALTAKAMKGDREECLRAGASDYIPKPVDMDKLFSLLRVWLYSSSADAGEIG